ncbi:MAG TPA: electron transfer flavoprotein subunit beta/FixA family protein [Thermomicrobiales bacterium]|nr:electron transfer flavoprotein subunit beta/FixA family protein [Thermomicrobiales bacterium]
MASAGPLTIAVLIKQVPDMNAMRIDRSNGRIVPSAQLAMSSYDEYAVEAALRLKESFGGEVIVVAAGPASVRDVITRALAMGADRGIHLELEDVNTTDTLGVASLLSDALGPLACSLVIAGQTSDDYETGQVGAQVAELLHMPVISNVVEIQIDEDGLRVRRDMEDGYQTVRSTLPIVLLSSTGLDQPRLPSLKGIMAAKKKPVETIAARVPTERRLAWDAPYVPAKTVSGTIVQDLPAAEAAKQLVDWLQGQKLI